METIVQCPLLQNNLKLSFTPNTPPSSPIKVSSYSANTKLFKILADLKSASLLIMLIFAETERQSDKSQFRDCEPKC